MWDASNPKPQKMSKKVISFTPNIITMLNLLSGCVAVYFSFHIGEAFGSLDGLQWSWIAIAAAAVFDFCDGATARALKAYSEVGKELDSLSDLVSFGVAPGMMMLNLMSAHADVAWLCWSAMLIPLLGAYRLAKFNVDTRQTTSFRGLPIPANALFWIGLSGWTTAYGYPGTGLLAVLCAALGALMVCDLPMFSLKFKNFDWRENFRRYVLIGGAATFLICFGISGLMWTVVLYVLISVLGRREAE